MNANLVEAAVNDTAAISKLSNLLGGAVFPIGLIGIFLTGANLFTGNCMYFVPAFINGSVPRWRALVFLLVSFLANFAGAVLVVYVHCQPASACALAAHRLGGSLALAVCLNHSLACTSVCGGYQ